MATQEIVTGNILIQFQYHNSTVGWLYPGNYGEIYVHSNLISLNWLDGLIMIVAIEIFRRSMEMG